MFTWTWHDLSWPIIGIFFWWLAGRSIEGLLFSRHKILLPKIRRWEVVVSLPVLAFGAIWAVGLCIDQSARRVPLVDAAGCIGEHVGGTRPIHLPGVFRAVAIAKATRIQYR